LEAEPAGSMLFLRLSLALATMEKRDHQDRRG
jgi:hypothetical protein